jgi:hypothetical protein
MAGMLGYSRPFYVGKTKFRSAVPIIWVALLLIGDGMGLVQFQRMGIPAVDGFNPIVLIFILLNAAGLWLIYAIVNDRHQVSFTIQSDGIQNGGKFIPWTQIARFGAAEGNAEVRTLLKAIIGMPTWGD